MQNPQAPQETPGNADLLPALCEEIEIAWNTRRDATVVDLLAANHPALAEGLYEFFALLIQAEIDLDQPDQTLAEHDARARERLETGGYAEVANIARREGLFVTRTDREAPVPGVEAGPRAPTPATAPGRSAASTPLAGAPARTSDHSAGDPPERATPTADDSAVGVPAAGGRARWVRAASAQARRGSRSRNFLGLLIDTTQDAPDLIAGELGITTGFLVSVDDLGDRLPVRAREELARRGAARYGHYDLTREQLLEHLGGSEPLAMAASRGSRYDRRLTYEDVVRRSKLSATDEAFWLSLAN